MSGGEWDEWKSNAWDEKPDKAGDGKDKKTSNGWDEISKSWGNEDKSAAAGDKNDKKTSNDWDNVSKSWGNSDDKSSKNGWKEWWNSSGWEEKKTSTNGTVDEKNGDDNKGAGASATPAPEKKRGKASAPPPPLPTKLHNLPLPTTLDGWKDDVQQQVRFPDLPPMPRHWIRCCTKARPHRMYYYHIPTQKSVDTVQQVLALVNEELQETKLKEQKRIKAEKDREYRKRMRAVEENQKKLAAKRQRDKAKAFV